MYTNTHTHTHLHTHTHIHAKHTHMSTNTSASASTRTSTHTHGFTHRLTRQCLPVNRRERREGFGTNIDCAKLYLLPLPAETSSERGRALNHLDIRRSGLPVCDPPRRCPGTQGWQNLGAKQKRRASILARPSLLAACSQRS